TFSACRTPFLAVALGTAFAFAGLTGLSRSASAAGEYQEVGDAIPKPLTGKPGDAARGRGIVMNRQVGLCLLCHSGPFPDERFQGTIAPDLKGAGARWTEGQLRLRIVDS